MLLLCFWYSSWVRWFCCYGSENLLLVVMFKLFLRPYLVGSNALFNADEKRSLSMLWSRQCCGSVTWIRASDQWIRLRIQLLSSLTFKTPTKWKVIKRSQNSTRNQGFSYYFCLMIEGSGSVPLTSRSGSRRPKTGSGSTTLGQPPFSTGFVQCLRSSCRGPELTPMFTVQAYQQRMQRACRPNWLPTMGPASLQASCPLRHSSSTS